MRRRAVLVVDDDLETCAHLSRLLAHECQVHTATSARQGLEKIQNLPVDLIFYNLKMPEIGGLEFLEKLKNFHLAIPTVIMTTHGDVRSAVKAMKMGAFDYILKPFETTELQKTLRLYFSQNGEGENPFVAGIVGKSSQIEAVWRMLEKFAPANVAILLQGESGTGKELFARTIHEASTRRTGPFVPVDCATLPETLVESELFGYEKGAFTGADTSKPGWFQSAHGGTLFLDEIGNLSSSAQAKLLRTLQELTVCPLGSKHPRHVDVRIISATNIDLRKAVSQGGFRADLYYRLSAATIHLPPLRERQGDIVLLTEYFIRLYSERFNKEIKGISLEAMMLLASYQWPGNIRELENVVKSAILLAEGQISPCHLPSYLQKETTKTEKNGCIDIRVELDGEMTKGLDLKKLADRAAQEAEKKMLREILRCNRYSQTQLATYLGIDRKTLRTKLRKFDLA